MVVCQKQFNLVSKHFCCWTLNKLAVNWVEVGLPSTTSLYIKIKKTFRSFAVSNDIENHCDVFKHRAFVMGMVEGKQTSRQSVDNSDVEWWNAHTWGREGWGVWREGGLADGELMWVHTERLTWPASSLSAGGFPAAPGRCGRGRCCGPPAPACWAGFEASRPAAPSSSCAGGSLLSWSTN